MIGMVLVTHGDLATEFRAALEHVVGPQKQIATVSIGPEDDMEERRKDILAAVKQVDRGLGVVVLTDMFGGTPSNLAISVMNGGHVEVVAGINLPMLIKLASIRDTMSLDQAVLQAQDAGRKYIYGASRVLGGTGTRPRTPSRPAAPARWCARWRSSTARVCTRAPRRNSFSASSNSPPK